MNIDEMIEKLNTSISDEELAVIEKSCMEDARNRLGSLVDESAIFTKALKNENISYEEKMRKATINDLKFLLSYLRAATSEAYDNGYEDGEADGRDEGRADGYDDGHQDGYDEGYEQARIEVTEEFEVAAE